MKRTQGPWVKGKMGELQEDDALEFCRVYGPGDVMVCDVWELPNNKGEMNARLIAAAPDLLEAIKYVVAYHREHDSGAGELFGLDYVTTCIDAIRQAEGKKPNLLKLINERRHK